MEAFNIFQKEFLETLAEIQETCVQTALCQKQKQIKKIPAAQNAPEIQDTQNTTELSNTQEEEFYQLTAEVIIRIMEVIDGYANPKIGRLNVICEQNGKNLKKDPEIELHDVVCHYLKGAE